MSAFQNCSKLKKVWLPSTLDSLGSLSFDKCTGIKEIYVNVPAAKLFAINDNVFPTSIWPTADVYVPEGAMKTYKKTKKSKKALYFKDAFRSAVLIFL